MFLVSTSLPLSRPGFARPPSPARGEGRRARALGIAFMACAPGVRAKGPFFSTRAFQAAHRFPTVLKRWRSANDRFPQLASGLFLTSWVCRRAFVVAPLARFADSWRCRVLAHLGTFGIFGHLRASSGTFGD